MGTLPLLVDTDWLAAHLDDPDLRILDSTTNVMREHGKPDRVVAERAKSRRVTSPARSSSICKPTSPTTTAI